MAVPILYYRHTTRSANIILLANDAQCQYWQMMQENAPLPELIIVLCSHSIDVVQICQVSVIAMATGRVAIAMATGRVVMECAYFLGLLSVTWRLFHSTLLLTLPPLAIPSLYPPRSPIYHRSTDIYSPIYHWSTVY